MFHRRFAQKNFGHNGLTTPSGPKRGFLVKVLFDSFLTVSVDHFGQLKTVADTLID